MKHVGILALLALATMGQLPPFAPEPPPVLVADFESGGYTGKYGAIAQTTTPDGVFALSGTPHRLDPLTMSLPNQTVGNTRLGMWVKAQSNTVVEISLMLTGGTVTSNIVLGAATPEWQWLEVTLSEFGIPVETITSIRWRTDAGVTAVPLMIDRITLFNAAPLPEPVPDDILLDVTYPAQINLVIHGQLRVIGMADGQYEIHIYSLDTGP